MTIGDTTSNHDYYKSAVPDCFTQEEAVVIPEMTFLRGKEYVFSILEFDVQ